MAQSTNPDGESIARAAWVQGVVDGWGYPDADRTWFLDAFAKVPTDAGVAGAFTTNLFELLRKQGHNPEDCLAHLHYSELPNKFRPMPLNHFLLTAVEVGHRVGQGARLADEVKSIQEAVNRAMAAALIRTTLPGLFGGNRVGEILRLIAKAFSGILFSHARLSVAECEGGWLLQHRQEHNFLAHFHYAEAYLRLVDGAQAEIRDVRFEWVGPAAADVRFLVG